MKLQKALVQRAALTALALLVLAALGYVVATQGPLAPLRVSLAEVGEGPLAPELFGIGTVEARRAYQIGPTVSGRVLRVVVDQGDRVRAGDLLAEMDPVDLAERSRAAAESLASASQAAESARAQLEEAKSRLRLAADNARRYAELEQKGFVSHEMAQARTHEANAAAAARDAAAASLAAAQRNQARAAAELDALGRQRGHLRLTAPVDGLVTRRNAEPGTTVVAGQAVVELVDEASLWLRTRIDQGRSAGLAAGLPAEIVLRSRPQERLAGRVARVDRVSDSVTEERLADIAFERLPADLSIGELAEASVRLPEVAAARFVPSAAVKSQGGQTGIWRVDARGRARFRPVTVGVTTLDGRSQILAGLEAGEAVILHSTEALSEGRKVKVAGDLVAP